jgi:hypothetical protein
MLARRLVLLAATLVLGSALASTAQAQGTAYPLTGGDSGLQYHIGGGLALPIQTAIPNISFPTTGMLLVPEVSGAWVQQTSGMDPKAINIVYPVLSKPATWTKIGVFTSNPKVYQVATNLRVQFPATSSTVMFSLGGRTGATTTTFTTAGAGSKIFYSNALAQIFGGPGQFFVGNPGLPNPGFYTGVNATVWALAVPGPGAPPCAHPAFGGANAACVAAILQAVPAVGLGGPGPWGAPVGFTVSTAGGTSMALATSPGTTMTAKPKKGVEPGIMVVSALAGGTIAKSVFTAMAPTAMTAPTNMAVSNGFPWTTGMIVVSAPAAIGAPEKFTLTGMDTRVSGVGAIQLVSGTLSTRVLSGPNANRAWLRLNLPEPSSTLAAAGGLAMLALCHGLARRRSR